MNLLRIFLLALLCPFLVCAQSPGVAVTFNSSGLASLRYAGENYLANGAFRLSGVRFQTVSGLVDGSVVGSCVMSVSTSTLRCSYPWGSVNASYRVSGSRLQLDITTRNNSSRLVAAIFFEPLTLQLPEKPKEYDGVTPMLATNIGEPSVLKLTSGANAIALVDEGDLPLMIGFPFAADRPRSMQVFPLRVNTGVDATYPDSLPAIRRPIAPGSSDIYRISLRFGSATSTRDELAADVYKEFRARHPQLLRWRDRRPIASLILGTTAAGWPANPRGWLLDPNIDALTDSGIRDLRTRIMQWAEQSIAVMRQVNAQGMITWDIEGEQYPQPTTYIGDPRLAEKLAPEMSGIVDDYFKKFRDAGFRVGVCIRPQQIVFSGSTVAQTELADPAKLLIDKIEYARRRWGATLFYVDSNGAPSNPMSADIFERVAAAEPDVLLIPEHETLAYYAATAPYRELRLGWTAAPPLAREVFPEAFSVIYVPDGDINGKWDALTQALRAGDILMVRGWFNDPANAKVQALYRALASRDRN